jgi:hypothetical protein
VIIDWLNKRNQKKLHELYKDLKYLMITHENAAYMSNYKIFLGSTGGDFVLLRIEYDFDYDNAEIKRTYKFIETDNNDFAFYNTIYVNALMGKI